MEPCDIFTHTLQCYLTGTGAIITLRPRQNGRHFADAIFKCIFLNENAWIPIKISLKFVPQGPINNIPALVQIMAWRRPGDKPLSGLMMPRLPTHICVTRPQWVKRLPRYHRIISTKFWQEVTKMKTSLKISSQWHFRFSGSMIWAYTAFNHNQT